MTAALFLGRSEVERLLTPEVCLTAVEHAFRLLGEGKAPAPAILAMHAEGGSFHIKAGMLTTDKAYFAAKLNANFPGNGSRGLPTLENNVSLYYTANGRRIKVMLNSRTYIELEDGHIDGPGAVGVWTKADSITSFDDFASEARK
jgi:ornithine cyclodeaminase/alanine dehydrogenase-like protein (mu-crystallin family)